MARKQATAHTAEAHVVLKSPDMKGMQSKELSMEAAQGFVYSKVSKRQTEPGPRQYIGSALYVGLALYTLYVHRTLWVGVHPISAVLQVVLGSLTGWVYADFVSGLLHSLVDHPDLRSWPAPFNFLATDFQVHHHFPVLVCTGHWLIQINWTIVVGVVYSIATCFFWRPTALYWFFMEKAGVLAGVGCILAHRWSHMTRRECPRAIAFLQDSGLLLTREQHKVHHDGFDANFCLVVGWADPLLNAIRPWIGPKDDSKFVAVASLMVGLVGPFGLMYTLCAAPY